MLVVARGPGQSIVIDERIVVTVLTTARGVVRLGVEAPAEVRVRRGELTPRTSAVPGAGATSTPDHTG